LSCAIVPIEWKRAIVAVTKPLRLHRAFVGFKNPALREAIVSLVIELAKSDNPA
jgi:hypothetical protein